MEQVLVQLALLLAESKFLLKALHMH